MDYAKRLEVNALRIEEIRKALAEGNESSLPLNIRMDVKRYRRRFNLVECDDQVEEPTKKDQWWESVDLTIVCERYDG